MDPFAQEVLKQLVDQPLHMLLGMWVGAAGAWFAPKRWAVLAAFFSILPVVFAIEVVHQWPPWPIHAPSDTWLDVPFYFLGAYIIARIALHKRP